MNIVRIALLLILVQSAEPPQAPTASITGSVARQGTNDSLAKATVELQRIDGVANIVTTTGDDGRFVLRNIQPGRYRLVATRPGFVRVAYGQRSRNGTGTTIAIGAGQQLAGIRLEMQPTGAIHGRIYDREGTPVINATVQALKPTYRDGRRSLIIEQTTITNDLGEYRLFWLDPGQYFVSAVPSGTQLPPGLTRPALQPRDFSTGIVEMSSGGPGVVRPSTRYEARATYAPTYFPGTIDDQTATPIDIQAGSDVGGIDIDIVPVAGRKVRGVVLNADTGLPARYAQLRVSQSPTFTNFDGSRVAAHPDTGSFEIADIVPGSYVLVASADWMTGRTVVEVGNTDVDNVTIRLIPGFDLPGRVVFEGPAGLADIRVRIRPEPMIAGLEQASLALESNGTFFIKQVPPGDYQVTASPLPDNAYIKSIRLGTTDVMDSGLRVDRRLESALEVVIGTNPGTLEGRVSGTANATVVLVPDTPKRRRTELYKSTFTDETGQFRLTGIAPGNYKVFAWEDVENEAWQNAEFIRVYEDAGAPVRMQEGGTETVSVTAIPSR